MLPNNGYVLIARDENLYETINHGTSQYPFAYYYEDVWDFDFHCVDWHWHPEVEFVYVKTGTMTVMVGADRFTLSRGQGLFINSRVIHRFESGMHVIIPNIVFSPSLLAPEESLIYRKYILPLINNSSPYRIFSPETDWQNRIIKRLQDIFDCQSQKDKDELFTLQALLDIWDNLYRHTQIQGNTGSGFSGGSQAEKQTGSQAGKQAQLQIMMHYIQENFRNAITLDDIAGSVLISKSSAIKLFDSYLHTSPVAYLIRCRLQHAARQLRATEKTISVISQESGFAESAYFCRKFKELYHLTPSQYRRHQGSCIAGQSSEEICN